MVAEVIDIRECTLTGHGLYPEALKPFFERMKRLGRWGEIVRICITVLELYPEDVSTRMILAETYLSMGFTSLGEFEIGRVREIIRKISDRCETQSRTFTKASGETVGTHGDEPEEEYADFTVPDMATLTLAELYLSQGRRREALALYQKILTADPTNLEARKRLAELEVESSHMEPEAGPQDLTERNCLYMIAVLEHWLGRLRGASNA